MKLEALPITPDTPIPVRRPRRLRAIALAVLLLAGGAGAAFYFKGAPAQAKPAAAAKEAAPVFELAQADLALIEARELSIDLPLSGSLTPLNQATVKSKVSGVVLETTAQEGMNVAAGQVIARLDAADQRARVAQQQAALDEANARLSLAKKNNANSAALLKQNYISQNSYDTTQSSVELAQAAVNAARAQLELARIALSDSAIRAPLSGVVSKRHVQAGEKVSPDMPVMSIVNLGQLTLEAQVPASDIPRVKVGQEVRFKVDGYGERRFAGKVVRINPTTEAGSRAMLVYISVNNADGALRGGMFAKGAITTEKSAARPQLPLTALRKADGQDAVYRIADGKVVAQKVTLGLRNEDQGFAEVTSGLDAGAVVLAAPLEGVKPGSKVKVAKPATAAAAAAPAAAVKKG
ncbi:MAG TPA: efflux RND transporter periplasmic adaptor subunit [Telluria sp.]